MNFDQKVTPMIRQDIHMPSLDEIEDIEAQARVMQAKVLHDMWHAAFQWLAHPHFARRPA